MRCCLTLNLIMTVTLEAQPYFKLSMAYMNVRNHLPSIPPENYGSIKRMACTSNNFVGYGQGKKKGSQKSYTPGYLLLLYKPVL